MAVTRIVLWALAVALGLAACGDRGPCHIGDCPEAVNCMPRVAGEQNQCLCTMEGRSWMQTSCPDTQYLE